MPGVEPYARRTISISPRLLPQPHAFGLGAWAEGEWRILLVALVLVMTAVAAPIALAAKQTFCYRVAIRGVDCDFTKQLCE
jgi:hypothetical protein